MSEPFVVVVRAGDCPCPGSPHTEERISIEPELTLPVASAATAAMRYAEPTLSAQQAAIVEAYLPASIREWTFTDEARKPVPINRDNLERLLPWDRGGMDVADACDNLYSERLMRPLLERIRKLSDSGPTDGSTSPSLPSGSPPPEPSAPSSPENSEIGRLFAVPAR